MRGQAFVAVSAIAAIMAFASPAAAQYQTYHDAHVANQQQCQQSRSNRSIGGAVIGGIAGALLGREVADRGVRGEGAALGAALGAVVGAVAGAGVGRATANCNATPQGSYDPYYGQAYPAPQQQQPYYGGHDPYRQSDYRDARQECRPGEVITRDPYGREYREQVMMCRGRDGVWRPQY